MHIPRKSIGRMLARQLLADMFDDPGLIEYLGREVPTADDGRLDAIVTIRGQPFVLEWKRSGSLGLLLGTIHHLERAQSSSPDGVTPLLVVPHMGKAAQKACAQAGLSWMDLSGNARIVTPTIFYHDLGHPNRFPRVGRPETAFGPRGSRIARHLLMAPTQAIRQRTLAAGTGLDEGHTSRIVGKLLKLGLVERGEEGISVPDADALLDAWLEDYRFDRHYIVRGRIPARGSDRLIHALAEPLSRAGEPYAATAHAAAWLWTHHASFRLATVYISTLPSPGLKKDLGFREEARGANTWLVVPNDQGVFHGSELVDGIRCVHPVQAYVDMKSHPERAEEPAAELRSRLLWPDNK